MSVVRVKFKFNKIFIDKFQCFMYHNKLKKRRLSQKTLGENKIQSADA